MTVDTNLVRRAFGRLKAYLLFSGFVALLASVSPSHAQVSNCPFTVSATANNLGNALMLTWTNAALLQIRPRSCRGDKPR